MKIINQIGLILVLTILLAGCKKEDDQKSRTQFILAGQADDKVLLQNFTPDLEMAMKNTTAGGIPSTGYSGNLYVDLDLDGTNDLKFRSFYGVGHSMTASAPSEGCKISDISPKWNVQICLVPQQLQDSIDENMDWHNVNIFESDLSSYTPEWINSAEIKNNSWNEPNLYLAYRIIQSTDTIYGWMGIEIVDYYKLKIKDAGLMK